MEKEYVPKHKPIEKDATVKAKAPVQKEQKKDTKQNQGESKNAQIKESSSSQTPQSTPVTDTKTEVKTEEKKVPAKVTKKDHAEARGLSLHASKKYCMYICEFIKGKTVDQALKELNEVLLFKRAIPMRGEIPHRSEPGVMSGRYPVKTVAQFVTMLKGLRGNVIVNGLDVHKAKITLGTASWASRPAKRGGARFKRVNVTLRVEEKN
jgi:large subunit ribosomal protein L22